MQKREVTDQANGTWTCVQAYTGSNGKAAAIAAIIATDADGKVTVICTSSGGAQTVRLSLSPDWLEKTDDAELLNAILMSQQLQV